MSGPPREVTFGGPVEVTLVLGRADLRAFNRELEHQRAYPDLPAPSGGSNELGAFVARSIRFLQDYRAKDEATHPREEGSGS